MTLTVEFLDSGREPKVAPHPAYPDGIDVDLARGAKGCRTELPYPAPRCGVMLVKCDACGCTAGITVAGRRDDPRSAIIPCKVVKA
jgi:hypothetical protein